MAPAVHENDRPRALHGCEWHEALNAHAMNSVLCLIHVNLAMDVNIPKRTTGAIVFCLGLSVRIARSQAAALARNAASYSSVADIGPRPRRWSRSGELNFVERVIAPHSSAAA
jgi:hypothetical protein